MIEVIPDKPDITDELAMSLRTLTAQYATDRERSECVYRNNCSVDYRKCPANWHLPEE